MYTNYLEVCVYAYVCMCECVHACMCVEKNFSKLQLFKSVKKGGGVLRFKKFKKKLIPYRKISDGFIPAPT